MGAKADDLISKAKVKQTVTFPPALKAELGKLMKYNDTAVHIRRVSASEAIKLCAEHGVTMERAKFDRLIRETFGRTWGNT